MIRRTLLLGLLVTLPLLSASGCSLFSRRAAVVTENPTPPTTTDTHAHPLPTTKTEPASPSNAANTDGAAKPKATPPADTEALQPVKAEGKTETAAPPLPKKSTATHDAPKPDTPKAADAEGPTLPSPEPSKRPPAASNATKPATPATPAGANAPAPMPAELGMQSAESHIRHAPTVVGSILQLPPGESAIERAMELTKKIELLSFERKFLNQRLQALEDTVVTRDRESARITREVQDASTELTQARKDLQSWADNLREQQSRLRQEEKESQEILKLIVATLEKMIAPEPTAPLKPGTGNP